MKINHTHTGDCLELSKKLENSSIQSIITSPPYFQQRDYAGSKLKEVGQEEKTEDYVLRLTELFETLHSKIKDDGTLWLNLGDKYIKGNLAGMPWQVALALKETGWKLRSDIIWHKPNAMPSSVKTRPTTDHEYLFLFSKKDKYYYDSDSIREPHKTFSEDSKMKGGRNHFGKKDATPESGKYSGYQGLHSGDWTKTYNPLGRNKRTVWSVPISRSKETHFAVFPEDLVLPCVLAGCPPGGVILDPFMGSGTVGRVALKNNRDYIGFELNPKYSKLSNKLTKSIQKELI